MNEQQKIKLIDLQNTQINLNKELERKLNQLEIIKEKIRQNEQELIIFVNSILQ